MIVKGMPLFVDPLYDRKGKGYAAGGINYYCNMFTEQATGLTNKYETSFFRLVSYLRVRP